MWLNKEVPNILEKMYKDGFCIIVISNQTRNTEMKTKQIFTVMSLLKIPSIIIVGFYKVEKI